MFKDFHGCDVHVLAWTSPHSQTPQLTAPQLATCRSAAFGHYQGHLSCGMKRVATRPTGSGRLESPGH